jgi:hypothetical protein
MEKNITPKTCQERWGAQYESVTTWLSKLQKKVNACYCLWRYCQATNKTPDELLALKNTSTSHEAELLLNKFVAQSKFTNAVTYNVVISVKSFYKHNFQHLESISGQMSLIKQKPYRRHSKPELLKIYRACQNPRDRAMITMVYSTAIAKDSLTKMRWQHLEPDWETQETPNISLPSAIIKGHGIGRYKGVEQRTFLTPEAKRDLVDYKAWFEKLKGVKLQPEDPMFADIHADKPKPLSAEALSGINRELVKRSDVPFSWHDARRYVETALEETKINPNWARKIRGRKVKGEEAPYSRPAVEQLRKAYSEAVPLLEFTQPTQLMELQKRQEVVEELTGKLMQGQPLSDEDIGNIKRYNIKLAQRKTLATRHNGGSIDCVFEQIAETQLLSYLQAGWQVVHRLSDGQIIVKR